jgi:hypothetical protein
MAFAKLSEHHVRSTCRSNTAVDESKQRMHKAPQFPATTTTQEFAATTATTTTATTSQEPLNFLGY